MARRSVQRIVLVDGHGSVRELLHSVLATEPTIGIVGEADDGPRALELVDRLRPDVVVTDIALPGASGLEATQAIKERWPEVQVVILTAHEEHAYVRAAMEAGATAYVLKRKVASDLVAALRTARGRGPYVSPALAEETAPELVSRMRERAG